MNQRLKPGVRGILAGAITFLGLFIFLSGLYAFSVKKIGDEFLKQLGITKDAADQKIASTLFGKYVTLYDVKNAKNILLGDRTTVTKELLAYTREYVQSADFKKQYAATRENAKPSPETPQTPEAMRKENIDNLKKTVAETEANLKKATPDMKEFMQTLLDETKRQLADAQDPGNILNKMYAESYPEILKQSRANNERALREWEDEYPADVLQYVKPLLTEFLSETANIDFNAVLTTRNGKRVFVNPAYERKNSKWKMAFRAGKEVVIPAREFVKQWLSEIH